MKRCILDLRPERKLPVYEIAKALALICMLAILAGYNIWATNTAQADTALKEEAANALRSSGTGPYPTDGSFTGSAQGYGGIVTSEVTVENGWISEVNILDATSEDAAWLDMAMVLPDRIVEAQTPNIDVVSGATFTSTGILNGVTEALIESMNAAGGTVGDASEDANENALESTGESDGE